MMLRRRRSANPALVAAVAVTTIATIAMLVGWMLFEFDRALLIYAQALVLSLAFTTYRLTIWAQRPPTATIFLQAAHVLRCRANWLSVGTHVWKRSYNYFLLNRFVWRRGKKRWATHWPIMVGCMMAMAIVVPLILGWVWFETPPSDFSSYRVMLLGQPIRTIPVDGFEAFIAFHGLVWASFPVLVGTGLGLYRRLRDRGDRATQTFEHDLAPLLVLMAIAATGLMMTISYTFLEGRFHQPIAWLHCIVVVATLIWLPFSKLIHIPQRLVKLAHFVYEHEAKSAPPCHCLRCGQPFASELQIEDLKRTQQKLGFRYELATSPNDKHYQSVCPRCRRAMLVSAQSRRWSENKQSETRTNLSNVRGLV